MTQFGPEICGVIDGLLEKHGGLCYSAGDGKTTFCAEQLVAVAVGLPVTDSPDSCVEPVVSSFGRRLNDNHGWGTPAERAAGMRDFIIAQIGSKGVVSRVDFAKKLAEGIIRQIVPVALRAAGKLNPKFADELEAAAKWCEAEGTREAAMAGRDVARSAYAAAFAAAVTTAAATTTVAAATAAAADAAHAAVCATAFADLEAEAEAEATAVAAAVYACVAAAAAGYTADAVRVVNLAAGSTTGNARKEILVLTTRIAVQVLRDLKSPGAAFLPVPAITS